MPIVEFDAPPRPRLSLQVAEEARLIDVCDVNRTPVPFSCRGASCGTCQVEVLLGLDELLPAEDEELDLLEALDAAANIRLTCCTKLKPGATLVRLRPRNEE